jgi:spore coat polysaccharide biosynthesis protein SpsF (cytidylyltransferase family)
LTGAPQRGLDYSRPMPRTVATIEARMTSTRLPGKALKEAVGKPMLELMIERLRRAPSLDGIVVATTTNATDDAVEALARRLGVGVWRGSENDVLQRVLDAATHYNIDVIVETTGDCPLIDPAVVVAVKVLAKKSASTRSACTAPEVGKTPVVASGAQPIR